MSLDGVTAVEGADYSADPFTGLVTFATAPANTVVISAGFEFDVPVRFDSDSIQVSIDTFQAGQVPDVPVVEIRI